MMMGKLATAAAFGFVIMMLASCTTTGVAPIPDTLLTCKEEPNYQGRKNISIGDVIEFTDEVALAGADCRTKLRAVRTIEQARKSKSPGY